MKLAWRVLGILLVGTGTAFAVQDGEDQRWVGFAIAVVMVCVGIEWWWRT
jgi:hypothetical protein